MQSPGKNWLQDFLLVSGVEPWYFPTGSYLIPLPVSVITCHSLLSPCHHRTPSWKVPQSGWVREPHYSSYLLHLQWSSFSVKLHLEVQRLGFKHIFFRRCNSTHYSLLFIPSPNACPPHMYNASTSSPVPRFTTIPASAIRPRSHLKIITLKSPAFCFLSHLNPMFVAYPEEQVFSIYKSEEQFFSIYKSVRFTKQVICFQDKVVGQAGGRFSHSKKEN